MNVSKRKFATLLAAITLNLTFFGTCADAGHAALQRPENVRAHDAHAHGAHAHERAHAPHAAYAKHGRERRTAIAPRKLRLVATAYSAGCEGCSGITRTGTQAGHGVVAVDPRVIPLGTKLYVPGYGHALAGDTGGDIQGRRIDLGFDSAWEARRFGRREIVVYVLRAQK